MGGPCGADKSCGIEPTRLFKHVRGSDSLVEMSSETEEGHFDSFQCLHRLPRTRSSPSAPIRVFHHQCVSNSTLPSTLSRIPGSAAAQCLPMSDVSRQILALSCLLARYARRSENARRRLWRTSIPDHDLRHDAKAVH